MSELRYNYSLSRGSACRRNGDLRNKVQPTFEIVDRMAQVYRVFRDKWLFYDWYEYKYVHFNISVWYNCLKIDAL